jgi:hypothetical protein
MQTLEKESIVVSRVGKFGVEVAGVWYGINKPLELTHFSSDTAYDVLIKRGPASDKYPEGKKYIAQIVGSAAQAPIANKPAPAASPTTATGTDKYWQDKDSAIKTGAIFHDAAQVTAALIQTTGVNSTEQALKVFKEVLDGLTTLRG